MRRYLLEIFLIICLATTYCYAEDSVAVLKSTGKLCGYQSTSSTVSKELIEEVSGKKLKDMTQEELDATYATIRQNRLDTLKQNAIVDGYDEADIETMYVTPEEWAKIWYVQEIVPMEERKARELADKEAKIKAKKNELEAAGFTKEQVKLIGELDDLKKKAK